MFECRGGSRHLQHSHGRMSDFVAGNSPLQTADFAIFATYIFLYENSIQNSISWIPSLVYF